ncbi:unnamed protein product, partial [Ectocarpus sp. 8 AP-2014]
GGAESGVFFCSRQSGGEGACAKAGTRAGRPGLDVRDGGLRAQRRRRGRAVCDRGRQGRKDSPHRDQERPGQRPGRRGDVLEGRRSRFRGGIVV